MKKGYITRLCMWAIMCYATSGYALTCDQDLKSQLAYAYNNDRTTMFVDAVNCIKRDPTSSILNVLGNYWTMSKSASRDAFIRQNVIRANLADALIQSHFNNYRITIPIGKIRRYLETVLIDGSSKVDRNVIPIVIVALSRFDDCEAAELIVNTMEAEHETSVVFDVGIISLSRMCSECAGDGIQKIRGDVECEKRNGRIRRLLSESFKYSDCSLRD